MMPCCHKHQAFPWLHAQARTQAFNASLCVLRRDDELQPAILAHLYPNEGPDAKESRRRGKTSMKDLFGRMNVKKDGSAGKVWPCSPCSHSCEHCSNRRLDELHCRGVLSSVRKDVCVYVGGLGVQCLHGASCPGPASVVLATSLLSCPCPKLPLPEPQCSTSRLWCASLSQLRPPTGCLSAAEKLPLV